MKFGGLVNWAGTFKAEPAKKSGAPWMVRQHDIENAPLVAASYILAETHHGGSEAWGFFGSEIVPLLGPYGIPERGALGLIVPLLGDEETRLLRLFGVDLEQYTKNPIKR